MTSDHLNPIVVKELRQGLKSRSFIATFIGLQAAMVLSMIFYFINLSASSSGNLEGADVFFWFMLGLMLLVFMPLRAFQAIHEEIKGNTLEMLFLTRMTAWDISFGKWTALAMQVGLLVCAVMPYLVLRYFLGSIDIAQDLLLIGLQTLASLVLVAIAVGLSSWKSKLLRGLVITGSLMSFYIIPMSLVGFAMSGGSTRWLDWGPGLILLVAALLVGLFFIEDGAAQIAPPAENHAKRKRMIAFCIFLAVLAAALAGGGEHMYMIVGLVIMIPILVDALCEPVLLIPTLYKGGNVRNPFRWLLMPGWASGVLFTFVMLALFAISALAMEADLDNTTHLFLSLFNLLLFPIAILVHIPVLQGKNFAAYFIMQVISFVITVVVSMFIGMSGMDFDEEIMGSIFPLMGFVMSLVDEGDDLITVLILLASVGILISILSRLQAPLRRIQELAKRV